MKSSQLKKANLLLNITIAKSGLDNIYQPNRSS